MCKLNYDDIQDIFQILQKSYNSKKVDFFQLFSNSPLYIISEKNKAIGIEVVGFKNYVKEFYKSKKKELGLKSIKQTEEFIKGSLYNLYKLELSNCKLEKNKEKERVIFNAPITIKKNIMELCPA